MQLEGPFGTWLANDGKKSAMFLDWGRLKIKCVLVLKRKRCCDWLDFVVP